MPKIKATIESEEEKKSREIIENIAKNIKSLSRSVVSLLHGPLKKRALVILLASSSGLPMNTVERVIKALEDLESDWLNK